MRVNYEVNSKFKFDNFVGGKRNELIVSVAKQVASGLGGACNPLFIYGKIGVGKTHLLHAIGNECKANKPETKVCYIHSLDFVREMASGFQSKRLDELKQYFSSLDLLLIDNIQFVSSKPGTQQEFYYVTETLLDLGKSIVVTSDTSPSKFTGIDPKLVSRFQGGFVCKLRRPDLDAKLAILHHKCNSLSCLIEENVGRYIVNYFGADTRSLEGAINRIHAHAKLLSCPISIDLVDKTFPHLQKKRYPLGI
jgi:chromosomal replication initiator protein